jgi:putative ABC transport system permease protein
VLIGALATSRFQRIREGALLRALGATRGQVYGVVLAEYVSLGILASGVAIVLATVASWALARFVFEHPFDLPVVTLFLFFGGLTSLTVLVGLANSRDVVRHVRDGRPEAMRLVPPSAHSTPPHPEPVG